MTKKKLKKALRNTLIIVSGIPRSGTSLMMQMLQAGGLEILSDFKRKPDKSNPKGYLELEAVKKLDKDNSCLQDEEGKVVKVISHLLRYLPESKKYKIIFMNREINEIIKSQQKMLGEDEEAQPKALIEAFLKSSKTTKEWISSQDNMDLLNLNYSEVVKHPQEQVKKIMEFLNLPLKSEKMINKVDPNLYRSKIKSKHKKP